MCHNKIAFCDDDHTGLVVPALRILFHQGAQTRSLGGNKRVVLDVVESHRSSAVKSRSLKVLVRNSRTMALLRCALSVKSASSFDHAVPLFSKRARRQIAVRPPSAATIAPVT